MGEGEEAGIAAPGILAIENAAAATAGCCEGSTPWDGWC